MCKIHYIYHDLTQTESKTHTYTSMLFSRSKAHLQIVKKLRDGHLTEKCITVFFSVLGFSRGRYSYFLMQSKIESIKLSSMKVAVKRFWQRTPMVVSLWSGWHYPDRNILWLFAHTYCIDSVTGPLSYKTVKVYCYVWEGSGIFPPFAEHATQSFSK